MPKIPKTSNSSLDTGLFTVHRNPIKYYLLQSIDPPEVSLAITISISITKLSGMITPIIIRITSDESLFLEPIRPLYTSNENRVDTHFIFKVYNR